MAVEVSGALGWMQAKAPINVCYKRGGYTVSSAMDHEYEIDYFVDEHRASVDDIVDSPFTVVYGEHLLRCAVHAFRSRDSYLDFASKGRQSRYLPTSIGHEELFKRIRRADRITPRHPRSQSIEEEIKALATATGGPEREVWTNAATGTSIVEGPLLSSIVLHENRDLSGSFVYIPHWWATADFSANHMDNRASCVTLAGSFATLWDGMNFTGRKLDIILPFAIGFPLWKAEFEDIASSAFAWGFW